LEKQRPSLVVDEDERPTGRLVDAGKGRVSSVEEPRFKASTAASFRLSFVGGGRELLRPPSLVEP
jgi:hypothetical protein